MAYQRVVSLQGDLAPARFGHTTTAVGGGKVILFGGAVGGKASVRGFDGASDVGRYTITADLYLFDLVNNVSTKLESENTPSPRAAHAAACVESMQVVVFGGATGGGSLSSDELYLLDLRREKHLSWITVPTTGRSPGRRYGHTMVFCKPNLIVIGGNDGQQASNDVWFLNVEKSPFCWVEVVFPPTLKQPPKRVYHSADLCREGPAATMIVIFGGRSSDNRSLNDIWGLRQHRDSTWDWMEAPVRFVSVPEPRYQHSSCFIGTKLVIIGGRNDNDFNKYVSRATCLSLATQTAVNLGLRHGDARVVQHLCHSQGKEEEQPDNARQFRHSSWSFGGQIYVFGGFSHQTQKHPTCELRAVDCQEAFTDFVKASKDPTGMARLGATGLVMGVPKAPLPQVVPPVKPCEREIRLSSHAHAVHENVSDFSYLVRKISIDKLEEEGRKINKPEARAQLRWQHDDGDTVYDRVIRALLNPNFSNEHVTMSYNETMFPVPYDDVLALCQMVYQIVKQEDTVLKLRAPIKVYGDIHGQYYDLMRLFRLYKCPLEESLAESIGAVGDIDSNDYLFLGDYVDRGSNNLEVICLLFALKCKYPTQIHLLRGNHEDPGINAIYGFQDECRRRLREDCESPYSFWNSVNKIFEMLPLGALIEKKILCVHGGIGKTIHHVSDIEEIVRPITVAPVPKNEQDQKILDILWSDPTDSDSVLGTIPNEVRDPDKVGHIVKFGPDRVHKFLTTNELQLIIRAHECVMDGFERFAGGRLITLFSATNYCNHYKNAGALLFIRRDLTIVPKLIYPSNAETKNAETWDMHMTELRPPTPPRSAPRMHEVNYGAP
ncbi:kelch repeat domain containing/Serine/threonine protein phosphatase protein, putative [Babesia bigemina]|uniref:Serine/threonine-protein phosphatase n=1 Tax=Babesia bigemina TaxID=5866 RepID=A0A061D300_BABBI|nr:kelch repeat domain containing/Serine/threonine protein phosphatase protein, putative [Babesia bigemina]CDR94993.1 kelch repeat domain containing/Serine/threonine protein phosphatase protein, putative [Babesia bigemina]|eukprot:XP_012767179.1 kelch repeat domain containing/Serine/threonine protein phosphatase protein, putative [Babesia bigemina]